MADDVQLKPGWLIRDVRRASERFDRLTDMLVEDILETSDEEILAEAAEEGVTSADLREWWQGILRNAREET